MSAAIQIKPTKPRSRYVALDLKHRSRILAEGTTVAAVVKRAEKTGKEYSMMYLPPKGKTFIY